MTVTQTYLMYIVVLLMLELLLRIDMRKRPKAYGWLQSDEENFCNVKQKIVKHPLGNVVEFHPDKRESQRSGFILARQDV